MNLEIFFSVVVPSYNRADMVKETICSLLEQIYFHFELIIVDDGSTDNTYEVVQPYLKDERIKYFKIENSERGAARNFGTSKSRGDYVTFLDSDDVLLPWHLASALEKIKLMKSPPAFHLGYEILHLDGHVDRIPLLPSPLNDKMPEGNFMSCMGVFLRRDVALRNSFDEDRQLSGSEDYELWMRLAARVEIFSFPEVTSRLIEHDNRSVVNTDYQRLIARIFLLIKKVESDAKFIEKFGSRAGMFTSYSLLYLALHLAMSGERLLTFKFLVAAAVKYPRIIIKYRFLVVCKKMFLM